MTDSKVTILGTHPQYDVSLVGYADGTVHVHDHLDLLLLKSHRGLQDPIRIPNGNAGVYGPMKFPVLSDTDLTAGVDTKAAQALSDGIYTVEPKRYRLGDGSVWAAFIPAGALGEGEPAQWVCDEWETDVRR